MIGQSLVYIKLSNRKDDDPMSTYEGRNYVCRSRIDDGVTKDALPM